MTLVLDAREWDHIEAYDHWCAGGEIGGYTIETVPDDVPLVRLECRGGRIATIPNPWTPRETESGLVSLAWIVAGLIALFAIGLAISG